MANYTQYIPQVNSTTYPVSISNCFTALTADVTSLEDDKLDLAGGAMTGTITNFTSTGVDDNASTTAITIDSSENVGIGVASPARKLDIQHTGEYGLRIGSAAATSYDIGRKNANGDLVFYANQATFNGYVFTGADGTSLTLDNSLNATFGGNVSLADGKALVLGTNNDLQIYHSGTASNIDNYVGNLSLRNYSNSSFVQIFTDTSAGAQKTGITVGGAISEVKLFYDGGERLATSNLGVIIGTPEDNNGRLFLSAINNTNEGGEIKFEGAGIYTDNIIIDRFQDSIRIIAGAGIHIDKSVTAGNTRLLIYDVDNATIERVTVGAADSGGAGYKVLRIPN